MNNFDLIINILNTLFITLVYITCLFYAGKNLYVNIFKVNIFKKLTYKFVLAAKIIFANVRRVIFYIVHL